MDQLTTDRDVCRLVNRFQRRLESHVREVAGELGMTPTQVIALRELDGPITAGELAERMSCEPSNATFVLDRLAERGLVERRPHPRDRRAKLIELTAAGTRARDDVLQALGTDSPLADLTRAEQQSLRTLLGRLDGGPSTVRRR